MIKSSVKYKLIVPLIKLIRESYLVVVKKAENFDFS